MTQASCLPLPAASSSSASASTSSSALRSDLETSGQGHASHLAQNQGGSSGTGMKASKSHGGGGQGGGMFGMLKRLGGGKKGGDGDSGGAGGSGVPGEYLGLGTPAEGESCLAHLLYSKNAENEEDALTFRASVWCTAQ